MLQQAATLPGNAVLGGQVLVLIKDTVVAVHCNRRPTHQVHVLLPGNTHSTCGKIQRIQTPINIKIQETICSFIFDDFPFSKDQIYSAAEARPTAVIGRLKNSQTVPALAFCWIGASKQLLKSIENLINKILDTQSMQKETAREHNAIAKAFLYWS